MNIEEHLDILKSFNNYLENIINSCENDGHGLDTVVKLSNIITTYYNEVNDDEYSSDSDCEVIKNLSDVSDSDPEDISKKNESEENCLKEEKEEDIHLKNFKKKYIDNSAIKIYRTKESYLNSLNNFIENSYFF